MGTYKLPFWKRAVLYAGLGGLAGAAVPVYTVTPSQANEPQKIAENKVVSRENAFYEVQKGDRFEKIIEKVYQQAGELDKEKLSAKDYRKALDEKLRLVQNYNIEIQPDHAHFRDDGKYLLAKLPDGRKVVAGFVLKKDGIKMDRLYYDSHPDYGEHRAHKGADVIRFPDIFTTTTMKTEKLTGNYMTLKDGGNVKTNYFDPANILLGFSLGALGGVTASAVAEAIEKRRKKETASAETQEASGPAPEKEPVPAVVPEAKISEEGPKKEKLTVRQRMKKMAYELVGADYTGDVSKEGPATLGEAINGEYAAGAEAAAPTLLDKWNSYRALRKLRKQADEEIRQAVEYSINFEKMEQQARESAGKADAKSFVPDAVITAEIQKAIDDLNAGDRKEAEEQSLAAYEKKFAEMTAGKTLTNVGQNDAMLDMLLGSASTVVKNDFWRNYYQKKGYNVTGFERASRAEIGDLLKQAYDFYHPEDKKIKINLKPESGGKKLWKYLTMDIGKLYSAVMETGKEERMEEERRKSIELRNHLIKNIGEIATTDMSLMRPKDARDVYRVVYNISRGKKVYDVTEKPVQSIREREQYYGEKYAKRGGKLPSLRDSLNELKGLQNIFFPSDVISEKAKYQAMLAENAPAAEAAKELPTAVKDSYDLWFENATKGKKLTYLNGEKEGEFLDILKHFANYDETKSDILLDFVESHENPSLAPEQNLAQQMMLAAAAGSATSSTPVYTRMDKNLLRMGDTPAGPVPDSLMDIVNRFSDPYYLTPRAREWLERNLTGHPEYEQHKDVLGSVIKHNVKSARAKKREEDKAFQERYSKKKNGGGEGNGGAMPNSNMPPTAASGHGPVGAKAYTALAGGDYVINSYKSGLSASRIARNLHLEKDDVYEMIGNYVRLGNKIESKRFNRKLAEAANETELIIKSYRAGMTAKEVAQGFMERTGMHISESTVRRLAGKKNHKKNEDVILPPWTRYPTITDGTSLPNAQLLQ